MKSSDTPNQSNNTSVTNIKKKDHFLSASRKLIDVQKMKQSRSNSKIDIKIQNKNQ